MLGFDEIIDCLRDQPLGIGGIEGCLRGGAGLAQRGSAFVVGIGERQAGFGILPLRGDQRVIERDQNRPGCDSVALGEFDT